MEGQSNPKKYNHPPQKVKSFGFIQVGLQAKTPKYKPWSAVLIPRFCYWINTSSWSPRLRAPHRKQLAGEAWMKQSPDPYHPELHRHHPWGERVVSERPLCDSGLGLENLPWLSVQSWLGRFGSSYSYFAGWPEMVWTREFCCSKSLLGACDCF